MVLDFPLPNSTSTTTFPLPTNVSAFHRPLETPKETPTQSTAQPLKNILFLSSDSEESEEQEKNSTEHLENSTKELKEQSTSKANSIEQTSSSSIEHSNEHSVHSHPIGPSISSDSIESDLEPIIEFSKDAPSAPILGPFCVICGKFGQYVCDRTDQDVCSLECKQKAEAAALSSFPNEAPSETPSISTHPHDSQADAEVLRVLPTAPQFIPAKNRWKDGISPLDSRKCPICGKTGHLAQDCHFASGKLVEFVGFGRNEEFGEEKHRIECESLPEWQRHEVRSNEIIHHSYRICFENAEKCSMILHKAALYAGNEEI